MVAVPDSVPSDASVTPAGRVPLTLENVGAGVPLAVMAYVLETPLRNTVLAPEVNAGAVP